MRTLIILALVLTFQVSKAQKNYYLIAPSDSVASALVISAASGIGNPEARYNLNADTAIVSTTGGWAVPSWLGISYTGAEARQIASQPSWTVFDPQPIDSEERIIAARLKANDFYDAWIAIIDRNVYGAAPTWTVNQGANAINNFSVMWEIVNAGLFDMASDLIGSGAIPPAGVITQPMLDNFKAKLDRWTSDHPRP